MTSTNRAANATDTQAGIKALNSHTMKSLVVKSCLETRINVASIRMNMGSRNIESNQRAYEIAKIGH